MANADSTRTHTCAHCGKDFAGRKKKFCTIECRDQHRKAAERAHINGDRQFCSECQEWYPRWLFSGRTSAHSKCDLCRRYKAYSRKQEAALPQTIWRVKYLHKRFNVRLKLGGHERCTTCSQIFPAKEMHKGQCKGCRRSYYSSEKRLKAKRKSRHEKILAGVRQEHGLHFSDIKEYKEWRRAQLLAAKMDVLAERNARQALEWYMREGADDKWVEGWFEALGKPWLNPRIPRSERHKVRIACDTKYARRYKVRQRLKSQLRKRLPENKLCAYMRSAVRRGSASDVFYERFGYRVDDLIAHLEKQFTRDMNWEKFDSGEIHIDHIIPKSSFDLDSVDQIKACWCLSNLRPMWAEENINKGSEIQYLL